jgi:hypothetical protein
MNLRLPKQFAAVALVMGCQTVILHAQGGRQQAFKTATPFASVSRHGSGSSALGVADGSVNQSIDPGITGEFDSGQSGAPGLDQIQSIRPGGTRSALALSGATMTSRGAQKINPSQAYTRPSYVGSALTVGQQPTGTMLSGQKRQGTSLGPNVSGFNSRVTGGVRPGQVDTGRRSGSNKRSLAGPDKDELRKLSGTTDQSAGQNPFERLQDPFLASSTATFEGFTKRSDFERSCGDACSLRAGGSSEPSSGGAKGQRRTGDMPDAQLPATKGVYGQEPSLGSLPSTGSTMKPF